MGKRPARLQEFVAHSDTVNCAHIGASSQLMATGGEDKKVKVWAVGRPNELLSLSGHTTPIECVKLDSKEEIVVAGAASGSLKLFDLETAKALRAFPGHRSNCLCVDYHPFSEYLISGSMDTNMKLWDIKQKKCIQTYRGHTGAIRVVNFSPDGRWVCSGGEDGSLKLWDLTEGKLLYDFPPHTGAVTSISFHPSELLMSTSGADKVVKVFDLEDFKTVATTEQDAHPVLKADFSPDGSSLISATAESVKTWSWEPVRLHDGADAQWGKLLDFAIDEHDKMIGVSATQSFVGVWVTELAHFKPFAAGGSQNEGEVGGGGDSGRVEGEKPNVGDMNVSNVSCEDELAETMHKLKMSAEGRQLRRELHAAKDGMQAGRPPTGNAGPAQIVQRSASQPIVEEKAGVAQRAQSAVPDLAQQLPPSRYGGEQREDKSGKPKGLNIADFVPGGEPTSLLSDNDIIKELLETHPAMMRILTKRASDLKVAKVFWQRGDMKGLFDSVKRSGDPAVTVDVLRALMERKGGAAGAFTLDTTMIILPLLQKLFVSQYEEYVELAMRVCSMLAKTFSSVISENVKAPPTSGLIDISREERVKKCNECFEQFLLCQESLKAVETKWGGRLQKEARDLDGFIERAFS